MLPKAQEIKHQDRLVARQFFEFIKLLALRINMVGHAFRLLCDEEISIANSRVIQLRQRLLWVVSARSG
jgi:hypothetical protein